MDDRDKAKGGMRDRHWDRQADRDREPGNEGEEPAPSGALGPSGDVLDDAQGEGGTIAPDPPEDLG